MALNLALACLSASLESPEANIASMETHCREAKMLGADLVVFPELSLTGYANGVSARNRAISEAIAASWCLISAQRHQITIMAGFAEVDETGRLFLSHITVRADGSYHTYRKTHLAPPEQSLFTAGDNLPLVTINGFSIGTLLCYDAHFPMAFYEMARAGADVIIIPHASPRGTSQEKERSWMRHLPARAFDNGVWVAALNQSGTNEAGLSFPPLALSIDPSGHPSTAPLLRSGLLMVEITREALTTVRSHPMRHFLPNTRLDLKSIDG